jgi:hypothetical protein
MTKKVFSNAQSIVFEMRKNDEGRNKKFQKMEECITVSLHYQVS